MNIAKACKHLWRQSCEWPHRKDTKRKGARPLTTNIMGAVAASSHVFEPFVSIPILVILTILAISSTNMLKVVYALSNSTVSQALARAHEPPLLRFLEVLPRREPTSLADTPAGRQRWLG